MTGEMGERDAKMYQYCQLFQESCEDMIEDIGRSGKASQQELIGVFRDYPVLSKMYTGYLFACGKTGEQICTELLFAADQGLFQEPSFERAESLDDTQILDFYERFLEYNSLIGLILESPKKPEHGVTRTKSEGMVFLGYLMGDEGSPQEAPEYIHAYMRIRSRFEQFVAGFKQAFAESRR